MTSAATIVRAQNDLLLGRDEIGFGTILQRQVHVRVDVHGECQVIQTDGRSREKFPYGGHPGWDRPAEGDARARLEQIIGHYFVVIGLVRAEISVRKECGQHLPNGIKAFGISSSIKGRLALATYIVFE